MGESLVGHVRSEENRADLLTKVTYGAKRRYLVSNVLYDICDDHEDRSHSEFVTSLAAHVVHTKLEGTEKMGPPGVHAQSMCASNATIVVVLRAQEPEKRRHKLCPRSRKLGKCTPERHF